MALLVRTPAQLRDAYNAGQVKELFWDGTKFVAAVQLDLSDPTSFQVWSVTP